MKGIYREAFFKVSRRLLESSLWCEDGDTVKVFLALIALSQEPASPRNGVVFIARRQLAAKCMMTQEALEKCLGVLAGPDEQSRTQARAGRRLEVLPNGFRVLNYGLYHDEAKDATLSRARSAAGRVGGSRSAEVRRSQRDSLKQNASKPQASPKQNEATETETDTRLDKTETNVSVAVAPVTGSWSREACEDWQQRFGGTAPGGRIGSALKPLVKSHGWGEVRVAWRNYLSETEAEFASPQRFGATYGRWNGTSRPGTKPTVVDTNRQVLTDYVRGKS